MNEDTDALKTADQILPEFWKTKLALLQRLQVLIPEMNATQVLEAYKMVCETDLAEQMSDKVPG